MASSDPVFYTHAINDLRIAEARYHVFIERKGLRQNSAAWQRALKNGKPIPAEMMSWVNGDMNENRPLNKDMKMEVDGSLKELPVA